MKIVIPSKGRSNTICSHKLFDLEKHNVSVVVPKSEFDAYQDKIGKKHLVAIPDDVLGLGAVRNWIIDHFEDEIIVMVDDDVKHMVSLLNIKAEKITSKDGNYEILANAANCACDAGCTLFTINQSEDVRKYQHTEPFSLNAWVGSVVGIIGRKYSFTVINKTKVDADYSLLCLLKDRIIWTDKRFSFVAPRDTNSGVNTNFRSQKSIDSEIAFLKQKWKKHIRIGKSKGVYSLKLNVPRKQSL
jgi:hypothetical protein